MRELAGVLALIIHQEVSSLRRHHPYSCCCFPECLREIAAIKAKILKVCDLTEAEVGA